MKKVILSDEESRKALLKILSKRKVLLNGKFYVGTSLSDIRDMLKDEYIFPHNNSDADSLLRRLGFQPCQGKVGKWTRKGYQYVQPATCYIIGE